MNIQEKRLRLLLNEPKIPLSDLIKKAWTYKGDMIPWPPSEEDVAFMAWIYDQNTRHKDFRLRGRDWTQHRGIRLYAEYHFGLRMGLKGNTKIWEKDYRVDFQTERYTIDVKAIINKGHRLLRPCHQIDFADILVCAYVNPDNLGLKNVDLLGYTFDCDIRRGPIADFESQNPNYKNAYYLYPSQLRPIIDIEALLGVNHAGPFVDLAIQLPFYYFFPEIVKWRRNEARVNRHP